MYTLSMIQAVSVWVAPVLFSITLHEAAHAWVASLCGDTTAKALGRLSLNPLKHVDPVGTVLVPIIVGILSGFQFIFGWAKPVPINWNQLRKPRRDMALVAFAGPMANFIMAFMWACCAKIGMILNPDTSKFALFLLLSGEAGILINLVLAFLNLIPIPPLDGSRVMSSLLPLRLSIQYIKIEPFGFLIILLLYFTGILGWFIYPLLSLTMDAIFSMFHLL